MKRMTGVLALWLAVMGASCASSGDVSPMKAPLPAPAQLPQDGKIHRVAGTGKKGAGGAGGAPDQLELSRPHGATIDPTGAVVVCDSDNNRVLRIEK